jgi:hypothetical protein
LKKLTVRAERGNAYGINGGEETNDANADEMKTDSFEHFNGEDNVRRIGLHTLCYVCGNTGGNIFKYDRWCSESKCIGKCDNFGCFFYCILFSKE